MPIITYFVWQERTDSYGYAALHIQFQAKHISLIHIVAFPLANKYTIVVSEKHEGALFKKNKTRAVCKYSLCVGHLLLLITERCVNMKEKAPVTPGASYVYTVFVLALADAALETEGLFTGLCFDVVAETILIS